MEKGLRKRNILRSHRSIVRRRVTNDLNAPYGGEYELELLGEETELYEQAVRMRLENDALYDDMCRELKVVDGAARYDERDPEQGENDQDKPTGMASGHALLEAAKATETQQRATRNKRKLAARGHNDDEEEPARKHARHGDQASASEQSLSMEINASSPGQSSIRTRLRRRQAKVPEVIEIDDSD